MPSSQRSNHRLFPIIRSGLLLATIVVLGACSDHQSSGNPVAPTPPAPTPAPTPPPPSGFANIAGNWNGAFGFQQNGIQSNPDLTASLSQNDRSVTGAIQLTSPGWEGWRASVSGLLAGNSSDTQFVGTIEITAPSTTGTGVCMGQATFAGRTASNSIRWDAESITVASNAPGQPASACRGKLLLPAWILLR